MIDKIVAFFSSGGIFMIPLVICSFVALTYILERGIALRRSLVIQEDLQRAIEIMPIGGSVSEIEKLSYMRTTSLARLVCKCIDHIPWSKAENMESLQTSARAEAMQLERGLVILEICVGIGPLLGLLGTVSGLIYIFQGVGNSGGITEGLVIAKGISEALNATVAGLVIAIPSLIAHSYYSKKVEVMMAELESSCMDLLIKLYMKSGTES